MTLIRRLILALALMAGLPAFAQAPAPVPALPDIERRTSYSISASTCSCNVNFALFGDSTDYQNWLEVWLNGVNVAFNDPAFGWTITVPTQTLATRSRPISDAILTFNNVQTGTVQIVGARRPRRVSQYSQNGGVPTRNFNQDLTDIIATQRELWDKTNDMTGRGLFSLPGNTVGPLPLPALCKGAVLGFDGVTGLSPVCVSNLGSGNVTLPVVNSNLACFNGATGLLKDCGISAAGGVLTITPTTATNNQGLVVSQTTPNSGSVAGPVFLNLMTLIDQAQTLTGSGIDSFGQVVNQTTGLRINHRVSGGASNHFGLSIASNITGTNGGTTAGVFGTYLNTGTVTGDEWGVIGYGNVGPSGNLNQSLVAMEAEVLIATGGVAKDRIGVSVTSQGPVAGTTTDAAFLVSMFPSNAAPYNGAAQFHDGIYFSSGFYGGSAAGPIASTGNIIRGDSGGQTFNNFATFPGALIQNKIMDFPNLSIPGNGSAFTLPAASAAGAFQFGGVGVSGINMEVDAFTGPARFVGRRADTSNASPSAVQSGELLVNLTAQGYMGAAYNAGSGISIYAAQTFTSSNNGTYIAFTNFPLNSLVETEYVRIQQGLMVGLTTDPGAGSIAVNKVIITNPTVVGSLPTCNSAAKGARSFVTDASAALTAGIGTTVAGSGANNVPVVCDGTNWKIG